MKGAPCGRSTRCWSGAMGDIVVNPAAVGLAAGQRIRAGAEKRPDGTWAPEDIEIFVAVTIGVHRAGGIVGPDGKATGFMVPVGDVSCPLAEFKARAMGLLNGQGHDGA